MTTNWSKSAKNGQIGPKQGLLNLTHALYLAKSIYNDVSICAHNNIFVKAGVLRKYDEKICKDVC